MRIKQFVIKTIMVLLLVAYLAVLYTSDSARNISMDTVASAMDEISSVTALDKQGRLDLKRFYQIEEKATDGYFFRKAASPMAVEEIFIVKAQSKAQAETFLEAAQAHLADEKNIFEGYGTDQMGLLGKAVVESRGNYVYYMCGPDASAWQQAFLDLI